MAGHAVPEVTAAVDGAGRHGAATMLPTEDASWVAGELAARFGLPLWQFTVSATDANRIALRLARHVTGRRRSLVFDWCYHGTVDEALVTLDGAGRVVPRAGSLGPPADPATTTAVVPFNDADALAAALAAGDIACVLAEPALTNIGIVLPEPGFLDALRELHPPRRCPARARRDPHRVRRARRLHRRVGARPRRAGDRQGDRRRHAGRRVRAVGRAGRASCAPT